MASARARLGKARRNIIKRQKTTNVVTGALGALGTVAAFGAGQVKKADTAWGEYEAGYKELGGEGFERPKFGQKGYFKGPTGDVTIDKKIYGREDIRKAGAFIGSDAAAMLDQPAIDRYMGRTAPGRTEATTFTQGISSQPLMSTGGQYATKGLQERIETGTGGIGVQGQNYVTSDLASSRTGVYDQQGGIGFKADFLKDYQPDLSVAGDTITEADRVQTGRIQMEQQLAAEDLITKKGKATMRQWGKEGELESIRAESKERLSTVGTEMPTFSPEFSQKVETGMTAYSEWEARNAQQQENIRINKAREDELAKRSIYYREPERTAWDAQILNNRNRRKHDEPEMY